MRVTEYILRPRFLFFLLPFTLFALSGASSAYKSYISDSAELEKEGNKLVEAYKDEDGKWRVLKPGIAGYGEKRMRLKKVKASQISYS